MKHFILSLSKTLEIINVYVFIDSLSEKSWCKRIREIPMSNAQITLTSWLFSTTIRLKYEK